MRDEDVSRVADKIVEYLDKNWLLVIVVILAVAVLIRVVS